MAKGARNKKRQKAAKIRREKFAPREAAKLAEITPNLEEIRQKLDEQKKADLETNSMDESGDKPQEKSVDASKFDEVTKMDKDGNYAPWLSGREKKKLQKANNTVKNKSKGQKKKAQKKMAKIMNTEAGRKAVQDARQRALDAMMKE